MVGDCCYCVFYRVSKNHVFIIISSSNFASAQYISEKYPSCIQIHSCVIKVSRSISKYPCLYLLARAYTRNLCPIFIFISVPLNISLQRYPHLYPVTEKKKKRKKETSAATLLITFVIGNQVKSTREIKCLETLAKRSTNGYDRRARSWDPIFVLATRLQSGVSC